MGTLTEGSMIGSSIYDILRNDHRVVLGAIDAIEQATDPARRKNAFHFVRTELVMHSKAEEEVLYRPLRARLGKIGLMEQSFDEHHHIEHLLMTLQGSSAVNPSWLETLRELRAVIARHVAKEETDLFHLAASQFSTAEAEDIGLRMLEEKGKLGMENPLMVMGRKLKEVVGR